MTNYLTPAEWAQAVRMWRAGADTLKISQGLKCPEALIYAVLPVYRNKWRTVELRFSA
jgi:hypothetical protein